MKFKHLPTNITSLNELLDIFHFQQNSRWYTKILIETANDPDVKIVTELGVFQGISTCAFLSSNIETLRSYDISLSNIDKNLFQNLNKKVNWSLEIKNSITDEIQLTDLLFLDTVHKYDHVYSELSLHNDNVSKYIIIHDTNYPLKRKARKVKEAINDFILDNEKWKCLQQIDDHTGMIVLRRCA